uniref:uncharacterized protein LOC120342548 isoform X2 n=1 Tax=Styela clava TaxID=7725 RepID=UPI00193945C7|nr:uncharacterized protein LOC120342548 isoform X2 [Styela clava]
MMALKYVLLISLVIGLTFGQDIVDPVDPVEPVEPVEPFEPFETVDSGDPDESFEGVDGVDPFDTVDPIDFAEPDDTVEPVDPVDTSEAVEPTPVPRRTCYVGSGDTLDDLTSEVKECKYLQNSCQVKLEIKPDSYKVYGECKTAKACEDNTKGCYSQTLTRAQSQEVDHVCHFCCSNSNCNDAVFARSEWDRKIDELLFR